MLGVKFLFFVFFYLPYLAVFGAAVMVLNYDNWAGMGSCEY